MQQLKNLILNKLEQLSHAPNILDVTIKDNIVTLVLECSEEHLRNLDQIKEVISLNIMAIESNLTVNYVVTNKMGQGKSKIHVNNVKNIILVSSGKGGVGKSTIAVAIAYQLNEEGYKVGIVDADIHGPSIPTMLKINNEQHAIVNNQFIPIVKNNLHIISVDLMIKNSSSAIAWRGPMISKMLYKMLSSTLWPNLDYLIIDTPPGTGDIHLSLIENYNITGAIFVTSPQKIATKDVEKSIDLYQKLNVKIFGIIENMSDFPGAGGIYLANKYNLTLIAQIKLSHAISACCDEGKNFLHLIPSLINKL